MSDETSAPVALYDLAPRGTVTGPSDSLESINTFELANGARCFIKSVFSNYQLDKGSVAAPSGDEIVAPAQGGSGRWFKTGTGLPDGIEGDVLLYVDGEWRPINFGTDEITTDADQTPAVADGHLFMVDATLLATVNRTITPSTVGAGSKQAISFVVKIPLSSGGFFYELVADETLNLDQTMWVDLVLIAGVWVLADWKPIVSGI